MKSVERIRIKKLKDFFSAKKSKFVPDFMRKLCSTNSSKRVFCAHVVRSVSKFNEFSQKNRPYLKVKVFGAMH